MGKMRNCFYQQPCRTPFGSITYILSRLRTSAHGCWYTDGVQRQVGSLFLKFCGALAGCAWLILITARDRIRHVKCGTGPQGAKTTERTLHRHKNKNKTWVQSVLFLVVHCCIRHVVTCYVLQNNNLSFPLVPLYTQLLLNVCSGNSAAACSRNCLLWQASSSICDYRLLACTCRLWTVIKFMSWTCICFVLFWSDKLRFPACEISWVSDWVSELLSIRFFFAG